MLGEVNSHVRMIGSAELQVVQAALRVDPGRDAAVRTAAEAPVDWQCMQCLARFHLVLPLVHKRLSEVAPDLVPPEAMQQMAALRKANALWMHLITADLVAIVRSMAAEEIPVLCLKGPVLAMLADGDPALRTCVDLDILVHRHDYGRAEAVLAALEWAPAISGVFPTLETTDRALATQRERHFVCPHRPYAVEVHWRVTTREFPRALETSGLFERSRTVVVNGQPLPTLGSDDVAMHLCHHGTYHCWERLRRVADLATAVLAIDPRRWEALLAAAHQQGLYRPMRVGMGLCHDILGMALPERIAHACSRHPTVRWLIASLQAYYGRSSASGQDVPFMLAYGLLTADRRRAHYIVTLATSMLSPTENDYRWIDLPVYLRWLYPILRPVRRIGNALGGIMARFSRREGAATRQGTRSERRGRR